ncbi:hypothetical protein BS47DRAFT_1286120, partial [Hydnum rufescens UP504]
FIFRRRMFFAANLSLSMLEPWEQVLVLSVIFLVIAIFATSLYKYLPHQLEFLRSRAVFYFSGKEL